MVVENISKKQKDQIMSAALDFGVQSYCLRNFKDNSQVAQMVREIGLNSIEICAVHADFDNLQQWKETVEIYKQAGVSITSIGVQTFNGLPQERNWFECAKAAGAKHISAHFRVDTCAEAVPKTAALAEEYDVQIGIHTHGGYSFGGSQDVVDYLLKLGGERIGLNLDTAWVMQLGPRQGNPVAWAEKYAGRVYGVHYKDFTFESDAQWQDVVVGTGNLDLPAFVKALENGGFNGMAVIEYEGDVDNPLPALKECVEKMRSLV